MSEVGFPHLHLHTTHSHLDGYGTVEAFYAKAASLGMKQMGHTEHGNINSWPQAQIQGKKYGVKPIFGIEAYVVPDPAERIRGFNHITILAQNQEGLRNLFALVSTSFNSGFYYKPRMGWKDILRCSGGLILFSGCWSGFAARHIVTSIRNPTAEVSGVPTRKQVEDWVLTMSRKMPGRFYMELMPLQHPMQRDVLNLELELAKKFRIPIIATNDVHYICDGDEDVQDDLVCLRSGKSKMEIERPRYDVKELFLKTEAEVRDGFKTLGIDHKTIEQAIANTHEVAERCCAEVPRAKAVVFHPTNETHGPCSIAESNRGSTLDVFRYVLTQQWAARGVPSTKKYIERCKREYQLLKEKNYLDYLLIIWDLIWAAKNRSADQGGPILVGPARGSAAGSLICYILGITEVDPFYDDLIFERFVDPNRFDPPDIDIDFPDDQREWVKEYLQVRWGGSDHVGNLISHAVFKGKNAIDDIARIYRIPRWATAKLKDMIIERSSGDARATFTLEDTFKEFPEAEEIAQKFPALLLSRRLEGQIRHTGTHAAGVIVATEERLQDVGAFYREGSFWVDKKDGEKLGFLKIDLLGLNTLTVLREAAKAIGKTGRDILAFYYNLPLDDPRVIEAFGRADVDGVFQFEGQAQMLVCKRLKPRTYEHVRDCTALSRPGPLHCGGTDAYIRRATGEDYAIEPQEIEHVVSSTYGKILYQEQVMQIMRDLGHMPWAEIEDIRRLISKSVGVEYFNKFKDSFMKGAIGVSSIRPDTALAIWDEMCTFGSWAFNRAHAASYTRLSMWAMYMKVYHPEAFFAALAGYSSSDDRRARAVRQFQKNIGPVLPICVNTSGVRFGIAKGSETPALRPGLGDCKGVGPVASELITKAAPFSSFSDFAARVPARQVNKRVRKVLHALGAFRDLEGAEADRAMCETGPYLLSFKSDRDFAAAHCFWVMPINFPRIRRQLKVPPLKKIKETGRYQDGVKVVGRIRRINQRDYRELGSEEMMKKIKPGEETRFINITIEDEEDFIMTTVSRKQYKRLKGTVFKYLKEGSIMYGKGSVMPEGRRVFLMELAAVEEK